MNVLDLFSGLGGWSKAFQDRGHTVVTVDNEKKFNPVICKDIIKLEKKDFNGYDFDIILASPPCTEFSKSTMPKSWTSVKKYGCNPNLLLLAKTVLLIQELNPKWWVIENVRGAVPYFDLLIGKPIKKVGSRYLWGNFPVIDVLPTHGKWKLPPSENRAALRSLIPYNLSLAICNVCENIIKNNKDTKYVSQN